MSSIHLLWLREVKRFFRSRVQILASLGHPLLYLLALGFGFGPVFEQAGHGKYIQFLAPGVIGMTVLYSSVFAGIGLLWDRQLGFLKETLVAPVRRTSIVLGRTLGGATVAVMQGLLVVIACTIAGFRPVSLLQLPAMIGSMSLIAFTFCALGTAIASRLENAQSFPLLMNFLIMPLFFLSGALFPLEGLPAPLKTITSLNPFSYGVDALRGSLVGMTHYGIALDWSVLAVTATLFAALAAVAFSRIQL